MQKQTKKVLIIFLKSIVTFLTFYFIYLKISEINVQNISFSFNGIYDFALLTIIILLMLINWSVEAIKWKFLVKDFNNIPFLISLKAVFLGISFAIFTPNRVGELIGRVFVLKKENRTKGIFASATGSMSQMMITIILGVVFGIIFLFLYNEKLNNINNELILFIKFFSISILILGLYFFFNLHVLVGLFKKLKLPEKLIEGISILSSYKKIKISKLLTLSLLRYAIFLSQYYLLLMVFDVNISFSDASIGIILTYFFSSVIPTFTFAEIGIRGTAAIFFIAMFSNNIAGIISATALLWIINLVIPAIIGSMFFYKTKI